MVFLYVHFYFVAFLWLILILLLIILLWRLYKLVREKMEFERTRKIQRIFGR